MMVIYLFISYNVEQVRKLDAVFSAAMFAAKKCDGTEGCINSLHSSCLQRKILDYFGENDDASPTDLSKMMAQSRYRKFLFLYLLVDTLPQNSSGCVFAFIWF